jgi:hypothetical protein
VSPPLVLLCLTVLLLVRAEVWPYWYWYRHRSDVTSDLALACGVLAYVAGHFRLQGLVRQSRPADERNARRRRRMPGADRWLLPTSARRPAGLVRGNELALLLVGIPAFSVLGYVVWTRLELEFPFPVLGLPPPFWRALVLVWVLFLGLAVTGAVLGYLGWVQAGRDDCLLYLQDQLWSATRGEQRRINRWLVWLRLRAQRRKEGA